MHDATADAVEYLPAAHSVHAVAPVLTTVFVIEPAAQSVHDATFELVEYLPASHAAQAFAPALVPASVIEPAAHSGQYDWPSFAWYLPGSHASHLTTLVVDEIFPAEQAIQVLVELSAYVPGKQAVQQPANDFPQDCRAPARHFAHPTQLASLVRFWYRPSGQSVQAPFFDASTKRPGGQSTQ